MPDFFLKNNNKIDFQDLMQHRIHEILLVASPYDSYILEEDGHLTEQILTEYIGMNFNYAPRVTRVSTGRKALSILKDKKFDLIILMLRIEDQNPVSLGKTIKKTYPKKPIILLSFDESELKHLPDIITPNSINRVFIWSGDASVFPAIIKYIEDRKNAKKDILNGNVRSILLIEDSPRMYSVILPLIYKEIVYQIRGLINQSLNQSQRLLHLRGRPKILLTPNFETAQKFFKQYKSNMMGIISDVRFLKGGKKHSEAGIEFAKWARTIDPSIPILLQSTQKINQQMANHVNANFLHKESPTLLNDLRSFMINNFGFGDFIFRLPNRKEISRATNLEELSKEISRIPEESLLYHANNHHFSNWLAARTKFNLASKIRKASTYDFNTTESLRIYLIKIIQNQINESDEQISNYTSTKLKTNVSDFYRLCGGSLGGKARGLAFARTMINNSGIKNKFKNIRIRVPKCAVIGTNEFDQFMKDNELWELALLGKNDSTLEKSFLNGELSIDLTLKLESFIQENKFPLAVRSSSLLEDSQYQPLAGTYETYMLPNNSKSDKKRLNALTTAIKMIFASTFKNEALSLLENTAHRIQEEKMAILIQEIVGIRYKSHRFYPSFSGVLQSINYYPVSYMKRNEGVAYLALGFGRTIVDGEKCLRVSPKYPNILPQFYSVKSIRNSTQNGFYALPLKSKDQKEDLLYYSLKDAEEDGSLKWSGSVISQDDNTMRDTLSIEGTRIVSFSPVLKWDTIPFTRLAQEILTIGKKSLGCPVEIEFAVNISKDNKPEFCLLQIKPMVLSSYYRTSKEQSKELNQLFCRSNITLGDGKLDKIKDLIIVREDTFDPSQTLQIAEEVSMINKKFKSKEQYILCGPGRWGSADPWLGIPVQWHQISNAKAIIEVGMDDLPIDPSFGSHFFQNIISLRVAYFTINPKNKNDILELEWLNKSQLIESNKFTEWYHFDNPITITLDGTTGLGNIYQPEIMKRSQIMDEEESSGI